MWLYLWDDDDEDEDEDEEDNTDPYGEDEDPNEDDSMADEAEDDGMGDDGEDEGEADVEAEEDEASKKKEEEEKKKKDDKDDKGGPGKKPDKKKMDALAKAYNFIKLPPGLDRVLRCPDCHQGSLYLDKITQTGKRIIVAIVKGVIGCDNMEKDLNVARFVCLNKSCKSYWKRTGTKYKIEVTNGTKLVKELHPFHADI